MRLLELPLPDDGRPAYLRIAGALRDAVRAGRLRPGEALPSTRSLADAAGVHRHTVMAALAELLAEGWVTAHERRAYEVSAELPTAFEGATRLPRRKAKTVAPHVFRLTTRAEAAEPHRSPEVRQAAAPHRSPPVRYGFYSGQPDLRAFPFKELQTHVTDALRRAAASPASLLGERDAGAEGPLHAALALYLRRARGLVERPLLVTHGSQEALFVAAQLLAGPGDTVAVEALGYPPAWAAFRAAGARLVPCPVDAGGLDPDAFDRLCRRRRPRFLYVTPLHQYPTTVTLTAARRLRLYEVALRHGVPLLEDDYDHEYHYRCQPLPPLAADDPAGLVVYVGTFSKVLFPSLRLGYLAAPPSLAGPAARLRRVTSGRSDVLLQAAVARWVAAGGFERHLRRMRRLYAERLAALEAGLAAAQAGGAALRWTPPDGGMALWLELTGKQARSSADVAAAAATRGVFVHPEEDFRQPPGRGRHLRLGFASLTPAEIRAGLARLLPALAGR